MAHYTPAPPMIEPGTTRLEQYYNGVDTLGRSFDRIAYESGPGYSALTLDREAVVYLLSRVSKKQIDIVRQLESALKKIDNRELGIFTRTLELEA